MENIKWVDKHIELVNLPKKFKKITGTRFAAVLGLNVWTTPFQAWCEITKTYEPPFEDTIYTMAGKCIEPKQAQYLIDNYYMTGLVKPTDVFGNDPFKTTYGDFYKDEPIFGGMWDYLNYEGKELTDIIECKTTKRIEDWKDDVPIYYACQGALYTYLKHKDSVIMICTALEDKDYPIKKEDGTWDLTPCENFKPTINNTIVRPFKISEKFPNFEEMVNKARKFWEEHVLTGISPDYDETKDKEYLEALRKSTLNPTTEIDSLVNEYETLNVEIENVISTVADKQKRLGELETLIKEHLTNNIGENDKKIELKGNTTLFTLSKSETTTIDKKLLEKDGLLPRYQKVSSSFRLTKKAIKEDK